MRHLKAGKKLNRTSSHRKAMFANMAVSLVEHELIKTTVVKAKEFRRVAEPLITRAAVDSVHNRRLVFAALRDNAAVAKLFKVLGPRYAERPGGYLRIIKCGFRPGDNAPMAYVELVDRGLTADEVSKQLKKKSKPAKKAPKAKTNEGTASNVSEASAEATAKETDSEPADVPTLPQDSDTAESSASQKSDSESK